MVDNIEGRTLNSQHTASTNLQINAQMIIEFSYHFQKLSAEVECKVPQTVKLESLSGRNSTLS